MAEDQIVFYHNPRTRGRMVRWMLEEVGAPYRTVILDLENGEHKRPEFLAINPMGKLPVIIDHGVVVSETAAIIAHLADAFPEAGLAPPPGDRSRGAWYRWLFFAAGCFEPALGDRMFDRPVVERKSALGYGSYEDVLDTLRTGLGQAPYLVGDRFTAADLYVGSLIAFAIRFGAPGLGGEPVFEDYARRMTDRPAYRRTLAADEVPA